MKPPRRRGSTLEMTSAMAGTNRPDTNTMKMTDAQMATHTGAGGRLTNYWLVGFIAVGATLLAIALAWRVKPVA